MRFALASTVSGMVLAGVLAAACSDDAASSGSGGGGSAATGLATSATGGPSTGGDGGAAGVTVGGPGSGGSGAGGCQNAQDCPDGQVCDPATHACRADLSCTTNGDCGPGAVCGPDGVCIPNTSGGECETSADCIEGESCDNGHCGCGGQLYTAESIPPNVLIVLDRSGSMNDDIGGGTKWDIARAAISTVVTQFGAQVNFGLMLYPGLDLACDQGQECGPGTIFVDVAPGTSGAVTSSLQSANTCTFGTPTAEALGIIGAYPGLADPTRDNFVLLVTDGQSTCADPIPVVQALRTEVPEIKTFVVGFGQGVDPQELSDMAVAGGTALPNPPGYYQADDAAALGDAFATIAGSVLSCTYQLDPTPPDPDGLFVYFDGVEVPRDPSLGDGWEYDPGTGQLIFHGPACLSLQQGLVDDLVISYGCPATTTGSGSGAGGASGTGSGAGGGGPTCTESGGACTDAAECCGGMDCLAGVCSTPVPN